MTPIQSKALDLASWLFIWSVRILGIGMAAAFAFGFFGAMMSTT